MLILGFITQIKHLREFNAYLVEPQRQADPALRSAFGRLNFGVDPVIQD